MSAISRRGFFETISQAGHSRKSVSSSLDEYTNPLNRDQVKHLLHRTTFAIDPTEIDKNVGKTAGEIVDSLFNNAKTKLKPTPPHFVNDTLYNPDNHSGDRQRKEAELLDSHRGIYNWDLGGWWVGLMKQDKSSILEKLTLFWHGHLTTQYADDLSIPAIPMYLQNQLFRENFAGNFYTLLQKVTIDGAMLVYLNGDENVAGAPNENYARELMELYSLGVGNYTEDDVKEAAKILTGWKVKYFADESMTPNVAYFNGNDFDPNTKKFFDEFFTVDYDITQENVYKNSVKRLIEVILNKKGDVASRFMMTKLYKYFVYARPETMDEQIINQLADDLVSTGFEFEPVLKKMLKSKHFFDERNRGVQLKSPAETIVNIVSHFKFVDVYARNVMMTLGLELFNPPNVSGWSGYRSWVSTKSLPTTIYYIHEIFGYNTNTDFANWADKMDNTGSRERLMSRISDTFFGKNLSEERLEDYLSVLGSSDSEWQSIRWDKNAAGARVKSLMVKIVKTPEFYLF